MESIYHGQYKEGEYFKSHKRVKNMKDALQHPLVHRDGIEIYGPGEGWQEDGYMCRVNLSDEAINFWIGGDIGEHMAAINLYGDTKKEAFQEVYWLLNDSFRYQVSPFLEE